MLILRLIMRIWTDDESFEGMMITRKNNLMDKGGKFLSPVT